MTKAKRIKLLEEFIQLELKKEHPHKEYIETAQKAITSIQKALANEKRRLEIYIQAITLNKRKRETAYQNRILIKAGMRESCRQRKIRLYKERRAAKLSA